MRYVKILWPGTISLVRRDADCCPYCSILHGQSIFLSSAFASRFLLNMVVVCYEPFDVNCVLWHGKRHVAHQRFSRIATLTCCYAFFGSYLLTHITCILGFYSNVKATKLVILIHKPVCELNEWDEIKDDVWSTIQQMDAKQRATRQLFDRLCYMS